MKIIFPDYYEKFSCTASACRHNCCIGWEIDIDEESYAYYRSVDGDMGKRLKKNIARRPSPHFILGEKERCPFLNGENLCDIYAQLGEEHLCQICADHPRFRNFYSDSTEIGLGLCCEAAAELVMSQTEPTRFLFSEDDEPGEQPDAMEREVFRTKYDVLGLLQDRRVPLAERVKKAGELCGGLPELSRTEMLRFFLSLERLDEAWTELLETALQMKSVDLEACSRYAETFDYEYEQLAVYFVYRHFGSQLFEGCMKGALGIAAISLKLLYTLAAAEFTRGSVPDFARRCELVRMFSAEIEYSQENIDALFDAFSD